MHGQRALYHEFKGQRDQRQKDALTGCSQASGLIDADLWNVDPSEITLGKMVAEN